MNDDDAAPHPRQCRSTSRARTPTSVDVCVLSRGSSSGHLPGICCKSPGLGQAKPWPSRSRDRGLGLGFWKAEAPSGQAKAGAFRPSRAGTALPGPPCHQRHLRRRNYRRCAKYGSDWRAFPTAVRHFLVPNSASTSTVDLGFGDGAGLGPRGASFPSFQISMPVEDFMSRFNNTTLPYGGGRRW